MRRRGGYAAQWERFARENPYYAVLTDDRYRGTTINDENRDSFFASGRHYADFVFEVIHKSFDRTFAPSTIVDFGCGVGRLAIPLSEHCRQLIAVDISRHMLDKARENAASFQRRNIEFLTTAEFLDRRQATDFLNAYIVFQHIPVAEGEDLLVDLLSRVKSTGFATLHFVFNRQAPLWKRVFSMVRGRIPGIHQLANLARRQPVGAPHMQMNVYHLNRVFTTFHKLGFGRAYTVQTDHGGFLGLLVVAQRVASGVP